MYGMGQELLAPTATGIWRRDQGGEWNPVYSSYLPIAEFWYDQGSAWMKHRFVPAAPGLFSADGMKTWQTQPPSLPGDIKSMARIGSSFLALSEIREARSGDTVTVDRLFAARDLAGSWSLRKDFDTSFHYWLSACGPRLFLDHANGVHTSQDSGRTWAGTPLERIYPSEGPRLYAKDSAGGLVVSQLCGDAWMPVQVPWEGTRYIAAINTAGGQSLAAVSDSGGEVVRIYPLPGASPDWKGIEAYPLGAYTNLLYLHAGILYAGEPSKGFCHGCSTRSPPSLSPLPLQRPITPLPRLAPRRRPRPPGKRRTGSDAALPPRLGQVGGHAQENRHRQRERQVHAYRRADAVGMVQKGEHRCDDHGRDHSAYNV